MTDPSITALLPTGGGPHLGRMLRSLGEQDWRAGDEVLLVSDDRHDVCAALWAGTDLPGRHVALAGGSHHDQGYTARNLTMTEARGDYLLHVADDGVLLPGAIDRVRRALRAYPGDLHVFPFFHCTARRLVGLKRQLSGGDLGTPNLVHPRDCALGRWDPFVGGAAQFIATTVARNPERVLRWHADPHYCVTPGDLPLEDAYATAYQFRRAADPCYALLPAKGAWTDLRHLAGPVGREDAHPWWQVRAATLFAGRDVLDVGAGFGYSQARLAPTARRVRLQDPGPDLPVDLACPVGNLPRGEAEVVTAFGVLEHVAEDRAFVEQLCRVATEAVFLTTPNWLTSRARDPHHCREYTPAQLLALLDGLPASRYWSGSPSGHEAHEVTRAEFTAHRAAHQAVLLALPGQVSEGPQPAGGSDRSGGR